MNTRKTKNMGIKNNELCVAEQSRKNLSFRLCMSLVLCIALILTGCTDSRSTDGAYRSYMEELNHYLVNAPRAEDVAAEAFAGAKVNQTVVMKAGAEITEELTITGYFEERADGPRYSNTIVVAKQFVEENPQVKIIFDRYEGDNAYTEAFPVMLMTENYGDIVLMPYYMKQAYLQDSKFIDLMPYIQDPTKFDQDAYYMNVINAERRLDGALLALPTRFHALTEFVFLRPLSKEFADRFEHDPDFTFRDLIEFYVEKKMEMGPDWSMHLYDRFQPIELITLNFDSLVDFHNKKANFTDPEFMELMEQVKRHALIDQYYYTEDGLQNKVFIDGLSLQLNAVSDENANEMLRIVHQSYNYLLPTTTRVLTKPRVVPTLAGNYPFSAHGRFAISHKSKNPDLAWKFLEFLVREKEIPPYDEPSLEYASERIKIYMSMLSYSYPINKANLRKYYEIFLDFEDFKTRRAYESQLTCSWQQYRDMVMDFYSSACEKLNYSTIWSEEFFEPYAKGIIWDEMYRYLSDMQSVEQTMHNIENKIQLKLNE